MEGIMEILDLKKVITFYPNKISREMLFDKPEMRIALMCLEPGQKLDPHKAPLRLLMYVVEGKGTFTVGDEKIEANEKTCILCDPMVQHGFTADKGERLVVIAVVTPVE
jgi:quercetin dioxygenase-like cupin family protein